MKNNEISLSEKFDTLESIFQNTGKFVIAVSGGVDSMLLAVIAGRLDHVQSTVFHAISPAVQRSATTRVKDYAEIEKWSLCIRNAGEFDDHRYMANPVNRCYYCKSNLYGTIAQEFSVQAFSGTNADDLNDYRPGLHAANENGIRHPYVEAGINKSDIRMFACQSGLVDLSELPSSPCLSSRVETGMYIDSKWLNTVEATEEMMHRKFSPETVRCRIRKDGIVIELDSKTLSSMSRLDKAGVENEIRRSLPVRNTTSIHFAVYQRGSAFIQMQ